MRGSITSYRGKISRCIYRCRKKDVVVQENVNVKEYKYQSLNNKTQLNDSQGRRALWENCKYFVASVFP